MSRLCQLAVPTSPPRPFEAIIVAEGPNAEGDFETNVYWVKQAYCSGTSGDQTDGAELAVHEKTRWVAAENIGEAADSHSLATGGTVKVMVYPRHDRQATPKPRFFFRSGIAAFWTSTYSAWSGSTGTPPSWNVEYPSILYKSDGTVNIEKRLYLVFASPVALNAIQSIFLERLAWKMSYGLGAEPDNDCQMLGAIYLAFATEEINVGMSGSVPWDDQPAVTDEAQVCRHYGRAKCGAIDPYSMQLEVRSGLENGAYPPDYADAFHHYHNGAGDSTGIYGIRVRVELDQNPPHTYKLASWINETNYNHMQCWFTTQQFPAPLDYGDIP